MTDIYLAWSGSRAAKASIVNWGEPLNILVSRPYVKSWETVAALIEPAATMLDSGAFSAWNSGSEFTVEEVAREGLRERWDEAVVLDVINDPFRSRANALRMMALSPKFIPVFHYGDPWEHLVEYCSLTDRVGLSCRFGESVPEAMDWLSQCFARCYPARFHSFGWVAPTPLFRYPFWTADTASWALPLMYRRWPNLNYQQFDVDQRRSRTGITHDIRSSIHHYMDLQTKLRDRWRKEFKRQGWTKPNAQSSDGKFKNRPPTSTSSRPASTEPSSFGAPSSRRSAP